MAFPATSLLDAFDRADSTTTLGSAWSTPLEATFASLGILTNQAYAPNSFRDGYWNTLYAAGQEMWVTLAGLTTGAGPLRVWSRVQNPNTGSLNGYYIQIHSDGHYDIGRSVAGAAGTIGVGGGAGTFAAGNKVGLQCIGSSVSAYRNTGSSWGLLETVSNTEVQGGGYIGLQVRGDASQSARFNDFGGGNTPELMDNPPVGYLGRGAGW